MNDESIDRMHDDDDLVDALRRLAAEVDPVPEIVGAAARAAINTRDLDRQLAVLIADSAADVESDAESALVFEEVRAGAVGGADRHGSESLRLLTFAAGDVQVDLEVSDRGDRLDLIGQFSGASPEDCVLEFADGGRRAVDVDELGRFLASGVARGAVRARFRLAAGAPITTAWVTI